MEKVAVFLREALCRVNGGCFPSVDQGHCSDLLIFQTQPYSLLRWVEVIGTSPVSIITTLCSYTQVFRLQTIYLTLLYFFLLLQVVSWLHWQKRRSPGEPNTMFAIQTFGAGAQKNNLLGCSEPPAREESWNGKTKPAKFHMNNGSKTVEHLALFTAYEQSVLLVNFTNATEQLYVKLSF